LVVLSAVLCDAVSRSANHYSDWVENKTTNSGTNLGGNMHQHALQLDILMIWHVIKWVEKG
jgi:hypothetical protein